MGLAVAHAKGIIHRDLKPSNIVINEHGEPVVMDFGLARRQTGDSAERLTQQGQILGTPAYMSPEQVRDASQVDERTDIYSLGILLYRVLAGQVPFKGEIVEVLVKVRVEEPIPPSRFRDIPAGLEAVCLRAIAKDPSRRYQTMGEFADALALCIEKLRGPVRTPVIEPVQTQAWESLHRSAKPTESGGLDTLGRTKPRSNTYLRMGERPPDETSANRGDVSQRSRASEQTVSNAHHSSTTSKVRIQPPRPPRDSHFPHRIRRVILVVGALLALLVGVEIGRNGSHYRDALLRLLPDREASTVTMEPAAAPEPPPLPRPASEVDAVPTAPPAVPEPAKERSDVKPEQSASKVPPVPNADDIPDGTSSADGRSDASASPFQNTIGMTMVPLPSGQFDVGGFEPVENLVKDFRQDASFFANEYPVRPVELEAGVYIAAHETTVGQFRRFIEETGYRTDAETDGRGGRGLVVGQGMVERAGFDWRTVGFPQTDRHPVTNVSHRDALQFCAWLSKSEGRDYRLPTEIEWERACRASTRTRYSFGDELTRVGRFANLADDNLMDELRQASAPVDATDSQVFTAPVGTFLPNDLGLYDMHGNVWEWCGNPYDETGLMAMRGAGWNTPAVYARSASRNGNPSDYRSFAVGFRVVCCPAR